MLYLHHWRDKPQYGLCLRLSTWLKNKPGHYTLYLNNNLCTAVSALSAKVHWDNPELSRMMPCLFCYYLLIIFLATPPRFCSSLMEHTVTGEAGGVRGVFGYSQAGKTYRNLCEKKGKREQKQQLGESAAGALRRGRAAQLWAALPCFLLLFFAFVVAISFSLLAFLALFQFGSI